VVSSWPDRPEEFFALAPKVAPKSLRQTAREETPVLAELAGEVEDTFLPVLQGTIELLPQAK
jgi:hypothetical protein